MKSLERISRELREILGASQTEDEMVRRLRVYIESLSEEESETAAEFLRRWREAVESAFRRG